MTELEKAQKIVELQKEIIRLQTELIEVQNINTESVSHSPIVSKSTKSAQTVSKKPLTITTGNEFILGGF